MEYFDEITSNSTLHCESSYTGRIHLSQYYVDILVSFTAFVLILNLFGNSAVIYALVKTRQLYNVSMKLILCLSASDCCLALCGQPLFITMLVKFETHAYYCSFDMAVEFSVYTFCHASAYIIILIGYDRFFHMKYLNRYSEFVKSWQVYVALATAMFLSVLQASVQIISIRFDSYRTVKMVLIFVDILKMSLMLLPYMFAVGAVKNHRRQSENKRMLKRVDREFSSIALRITISITILYTPYVLFDILRFSLHSTSSIRHSIWFNFGMFMGYELGMANSFVNAIIFLWSNKKCQRRLLTFVKKDSRNVAESEATMSEGNVTNRARIDVKLGTLDNRVSKAATIRDQTLQRINIASHRDQSVISNKYI